MRFKETADVHQKWDMKWRLQGDLHDHTGASEDTTYKVAHPSNVFAKIARENMGVALITDHNTVDGYRYLKDEGFGQKNKGKNGDPILMMGVEVTTSPNNDHIILIADSRHEDRVRAFIRDTTAKGIGTRRPQVRSLLNFVNDFPADEMVAILAHPLNNPNGRVSMDFDDVRETAKRYKRKMLGISLPRQQLLVEVMNGYQMNLETNSNGKSLSKRGRYEYRLMKERMALAVMLGLPVTAGSDAHQTRSVGKVYTKFKAHGRVTENDVIDMLSRGMTIPYSPRLHKLVKDGVVDLKRDLG